MENVWDMEKTRRLFMLAEQAAETGGSLSSVFYRLAKETGSSVGSVRNYYYSQAKLFKLMPKLCSQMGIAGIRQRGKNFELFTKAETREIVERAITAKAEGKSVRLTLKEMSDGDDTLALRLQNKYRSLLAHHRPLVEDVMQELDCQNRRYYNPYTKSVVSSSTKNKLSAVLEKIDSLSGEEKEVLLRKILL